MTSLAHTPYAGGADYSGDAAVGGRLRPFATLRRWWIRHAARQDLLELDAHMLSDIGLTRGDAVLEWQKAFWEA